MNLPDGRVEVRTRYCDFDGKARLVSARAATKSAALAELKKRLARACQMLCVRTPVRP